MSIKKSNSYFLKKIITRFFLIKEEEFQAVSWSFLYFFSILSSYYMLRPFREEMGISGEINNLPWLFSGTFLAMLFIVPVFGLITRRYSRQQFMPFIYLFFSLNIVAFYVLFKTKVPIQIIASTFFIWISVFNLFIISVFWSFMADIFTKEQSKRLFGLIASGGSLGAISGPLLAAFFSDFFGYSNILPISALLLLIATLAIYKLNKWSKSNKQNIYNVNLSKPIGGKILAGILTVVQSRFLLAICSFILLYSIVSTFLYFEQAHIVKNTYIDPSERTALFAGIDFITNIISISSQLLFTNRIIQKFGLAILLALVPFLVMIGFVGLSFYTTLPVLIIIQVIHRAGNFALLRPGKEILFTATSSEIKYKAKNFMDTFIYRGGDTMTAWLFSSFIATGMGLSSIAIITIPFIFIWMANGYLLGKTRTKTIEKNNPFETFQSQLETPTGN